MSDDHRWDEEIAKAERDFETNKRLVDAGEQFRSQKPAPSRHRPSSGPGGRVHLIG